ncbi:MAG: hypothetical protein J4O03_07770 [Chloroflexi bacterium]|nr:hypothetical protein [Chloroflexota bacterium]MCI0793347.1 hypothetical protein [Chloroflexota bacterium]MCI0858982.1 hypothetical protein [Chloroflexota bacterium]
MGGSGRLWHFHGGIKMLARAYYEYRMVNGPSMKIQVGRRCPICGLMPNDLVRQEQQEALEQKLLPGFKNRPRRRA